VTVSDNENPEFDSAPENIEVGTDSGENFAAVSWKADHASATDNSGIPPTINCSRQSGSEFAIGDHLVTVTAVDNAGNQSTTQFTITVNDDEDPVFASFPTDIEVVIVHPLTDTVVSWTQSTASDNAAGVSVSRLDAGPPNGGPEKFDISAYVVKYEARDTAGNVVTAEFTVTVVQTPPASVTYEIKSAAGGTFVFSSSNDDPACNFLNATINVSGGAGTSGRLEITPGSYDGFFAAPADFGIESIECTDIDSDIAAASKQGQLNLASGEHITCTITALDSVAETTALNGEFLSQRTRIILDNSPNVGRRLQLLSGEYANTGDVNAFGLSYKDGDMPLNIALGDDQSKFSYSLRRSLTAAGESTISGQLDSKLFLPSTSADMSDRSEDGGPLRLSDNISAYGTIQHSGNELSAGFHLDKNRDEATPRPTTETAYALEAASCIAPLSTAEFDKRHTPQSVNPLIC
jgi:hypothetical protein